MFEKYLRTGPRADTAGRRSPRRTKPSLERLDVRLAPSGLQPAVVVAPVHMPEGRPFVATGLAAQTWSPWGIHRGGHHGPDRVPVVPDAQFGQ
jgi:hypothetical protein